MSNENEEKSFWRTLPGILTGTAAIITAITGLLIALNAAGIITIPPIFPTPTPTPTSTPTSQPLPSGISPIPTSAKTILPSTPLPTSISSSTSTKNFADCFPEVPQNRTVTLESGARYASVTLVYSVDITSSSQGEPIVIRLTELGNPVGYTKVLLFKNNRINKIVKIVDPNCQVIEEYSTLNPGSSDKHIFPVEIKFGNDYYGLSVYYSFNGQEVVAEFWRNV